MDNRYILITAAKNEEAYIEGAIQSVLRQNLLPVAWFIVDDGSTDRTPQIVERFAAQHPFIHLRRIGSASDTRDFGSKDKAINATYQAVRELKFDFVGVHDADITLEREDYFESILGEFERNPGLGITGGYIYEPFQGGWQCRKGNSTDSVPGSVQMFRRKYFELMGGFTPLRYGGSDSLAELDVLIAGGEVFSRSDLRVFHYRPTSSAVGIWRGIFRTGFEDASLGYHPVFEVFKCLRRLTSRPIVAGSAVRFCGYLWWKMMGRKPVIHPAKVAFLRQQQLTKLRSRLWPLGVRVRRQSSRS